ncbi:MAG: multidrug resistance transporter, Bcr family [Caulobacter sp.]|nr:multidrug resistance transporter, Bcr family [Caulobacter sp.]
MAEGKGRGYVGAVTTAPNTAKTPYQAPATPWGLVIMLGSVTAFAPMSIDMYLPSLNSLGQSLGAGPAQAQATLAAFLAGMAVGQFVYGPASDRWGRRMPILIGIGIYVVASVACALAPTIDALIAARFVQALGGCAGGVVARAVVRDRFNHTETARMLSLMMLIMGLAPVLAPLAGGAILLAGGWRTIFWVLTVFGLLVGAAVFFKLKESRSEATAAQARSEHPFRAYLTVLKSRRLLGYALAGSLNGAVLFTYISGSSDLVSGVYGFSPQAYSFIFALNAFAIIGASQVNRYLLRRHSPDFVLGRASLAATGLAVILVAAAATGFGGMWTVLPLLFLTLASYGLMQGNTMAGALSVDPLRAGSVSALMGGFSFAVGAGASWLNGVLHNGTPVPMTGVMLGALICSMIALYTLALPKRVQEVPTV